MSLFEIIGEWISPSPIGKVGLHRGVSHLPPTWVVLTRAAISIAGLTVLLVVLGIPNGLGPTLACLAYVLLATVLRPEPDLSNVGWLGGLVDHPFRLGDDINRFLVYLLLLLWPGRLIGSGLIMLGRWLVAVFASPR